MAGGQLRDIVILVAGRGLQVVVGLATLYLMTTLLAPEAVGSVTQALSVTGLLYATLMAPVAMYVGRGLLGWVDAGVLADRLRRTLGYFALCALTTAGLLWLALQEIEIVVGMSATLVAAAALVYLATFSLHTLGTTGLNILGDRIGYVVMANLGISTALLLAALLASDRAEAGRWFLGYCTGFAASSVSVALLLRRGRRAAARSQDPGLPFTAVAVFAFAWPQIVTHMLWWTQSQSYRFLLDDLVGIRYVGLFAAAYMVCSAPMQTFEALFTEFYAPRYFRDLRGTGTAAVAHAWEAYARAYVPAVVLFGVILAGAAPLLVKVLLGPSFQIVAGIVVWPALTETLRAMSSSLTVMGIGKVDMRISIPPVLVGALAGPTLVLVLAPLDPLAGTGIALLLAAVLMFAAALVMIRRSLPVRWPTRRMLLAALLGSPVALVGTLLTGGNAAAVGPGEAAAILAGFGVYAIWAQFLLARPWLGGHSDFGNAG